MHIKLGCMAALFVVSLAQASDNQLQNSQFRPGTITNITHGDMRAHFYQHPEPTSLLEMVGLKTWAKSWGVKFRERNKYSLDLIASAYIHSQQTITFDENVCAISLPTLHNQLDPDIYLIDQQHAYTLTFNENGKRIVTTIEDGKIKEPITFDQKMTLVHHVRLAQLDIQEHGTITSSPEAIDRYQWYRNKFPKEAFEIEREHGFYPETNIDGYVEITSLSNLPRTENNSRIKEKKQEYKVEEVD